MLQRSNLFVAKSNRVHFAPKEQPLCSKKMKPCYHSIAPEGQPIKNQIVRDTYTQLYIQLVFAVKARHSFTNHSWEENLHKYITAVVQNDKHKMLAINGMPDHIHIFLGLNPAISISDLVKDIKRASNNLINGYGLMDQKFEWQAGYGAFPYSRSHIDSVCNYIANQKNHHNKQSFKKNTSHF